MRTLDDRWLQELKYGYEYRLEDQRQVNAFALAATRGIFLANGAAAIALLSLLGSIWAKANVDAKSMTMQVAPALRLFCFRVAAAIFASALSYLALLIWVEAQKRGKNTGKLFWTGEILRDLAIVAGAAGIILFCWGIFLSADAFTNPG
jgi:hypothetical protein